MVGVTDPKPTLRKTWIVYFDCPHCKARTLQVRGPKEPPPGYWACLQCVADGGTCCTLRHYDRHKT